MKKKGLIWIFIAVILVVGVFVLIKVRNNSIAEDEKILYTESEDGTKTNVSNKLSETKIINGLEIYNIELTYKDKISYLKAQVKNTNNEKSGDLNVNLKLVDKQRQEIITIVGYIPKVEAGQTTVLDTAVTTDIAGAYDFEVSIISE